MLSPDQAFQNCANAAAAAVKAAPAYISYRSDTTASAPALRQQRVVSRGVAVRTRDDVAVLHDLPDGGTSVAHGFPLTPAFDALSYFTLSWKVGLHQQVSSYVHDVVPLTYPNAASNADVVVFRLRSYKAEYAADSSDAPDGTTHISLVPYDFARRAAAKPDSTFFLSDLLISNATGLPASVRYTGGDDIAFSVDYAMEQGKWLVRHAHYEETLYALLHLGRLHVVADAVFSQFAFASAPPDARLAG